MLPMPILAASPPPTVPGLLQLGDAVGELVVGHLGVVLLDQRVAGRRVFQVALPTLGAEALTKAATAALRSVRVLSMQEMVVA